MGEKKTLDIACLSKAQVCESLGISMATLDRELKKNAIKSLTIGKRRLFTPAMVTEYIDSRMRG